MHHRTSIDFVDARLQPDAIVPLRSWSSRETFGIALRKSRRGTLASALLLSVMLLVSCSSLAPRSRAVGPAVDGDGIRFRYFAPTAHRVQLAGSWSDNNWAQGDGPVGEANIGLMTDDDSDGMWEIVVPLSEGRYQYLFWIDEATWSLDPGNPEQVDGGPQGRASEVVVVTRDGRLEVR